MRIAIMQPYFFPYPGYFELLAASDKFIFYDDVAYIKNGWINRNRIAVNGQPVYFTVPLAAQSSFNNIAETLIHTPRFEQWKKKFLSTLQMEYARAPYLEMALQIVQTVINSASFSIADLAEKSIRVVADYLEIQIPIKSSRDHYNNSNLKGEKRVIDIGLQESAAEYLNASGGKELYDPRHFQESGIKLQFLKPRLFRYSQNKNAFIPNLSILDAIMYASPKEINEWLLQFELETPLEKPVLK